MMKHAAKQQASYQLLYMKKRTIFMLIYLKENEVTHQG